MNKIVKAEEKDLEELGRLFNLYRIFYEEEDDLEKASRYISERFNIIWFFKINVRWL